MIHSAPPQLLHDPHLPLLRDWIITRTGLSYYQNRDFDFAYALERVYAPLGPVPGAQTLHGRLRANALEMEALVEQLTIGETFFFRHMEMFNALRDTVFPDLIRRKAHNRSLRIWSAGCSIGAEPYSLSILLREILGHKLVGWTLEILGTDINRRFLQQAEEGRYDPWALRGLPPALLQRCFAKEGRKWRLQDRCRQGVSFRLQNLAADAFPDPATDMACFDLIICRNVMIYFDGATIQKLTRQFHETLLPGGWLAVGHAEPNAGTFRQYRTVNTEGAVLYQRLPAGESLPDSAWPGALVARSPASVSFPAPAQGLPPAPVVPPKPSAIPLSPPTAHRIIAPLPPLPAPPQHAAVAEGKTPVPEAEADLAEIMRLADTGEMTRALAACDELFHRQPLHAGAYYYHGVILFHLGEWFAAERSLKRALYLARDLPLAHYYMGLVQEKLGRAALRHFANARDLLQPLAANAPVPMGQGLTAHEFRSLLTVPEPLVTAAGNTRIA